MLAKISKSDSIHEIISYCLTECRNGSILDSIQTEYRSFTFQQLEKQNVMSQQLYLWSAPIDLIENYQHFLERPHDDQDDQDSANQMFYNCTWPRFGPSCQFTFDHLQSSASSSYLFSTLDRLVGDYYHENAYEQTTLTCYEHLQCNRGPLPSCLDWYEICDDKIDCFDGGQDEEHCWQLEVNECAEDEFRCLNGQCVHKRYLSDSSHSIECIDSSDETAIRDSARLPCINFPPVMACQDVRCSHDSFLNGFELQNVCGRNKRTILTQALFSVQPPHLSKECWLALICRVSADLSVTTPCQEYCWYRECASVIKQHCPHEQSLYFFPSVPVLYGHLHLVYTSKMLTSPKITVPPDFICMNSQFCSFITRDNTTIQVDNFTCHSTESILFADNPSLQTDWFGKYPLKVSEKYASCAALPDHYYYFCDSQNSSVRYRCLNTSKCISIQRLLDGIKDCFYGDDEQMNIVERFVDIGNSSAFFRCSSSKTFISSRLVENGRCDCPMLDVHICDDEHSERMFAQTHVSFQTTCDGFTDLEPVMIDGRWMTDETDCELWLCDNLYTRCDQSWNCLDGRDEINCDRSSSLSFQCPCDSRSCVLRNTSELICLPVAKVNDGHVDCLGATDEPLICRPKTTSYRNKRDYLYCETDDKRHLCIKLCALCSNQPTLPCSTEQKICRKNHDGYLGGFNCFWGDDSPLTPIEQHFVLRFPNSVSPSIVYVSIIDKYLNIHPSKSFRMSQLANAPEPVQVEQMYHTHCHRGLNLRVWQQSSSLSDNTTTIVCLCPPSFYGSHCQFQNQRVSLTLQFRALSDAWQTTFIIVALLIDHSHQRAIHSAQQRIYLPFRDCQIKFNFYLLFATQPKNASHNYSVHFDIFEQHSHQHRVSYLAPIIFPFLPVYRLALQLEIPRPQTQLLCNDLDCGKHGQCVRYARVFHAPSPSTASFCQCDEGWSGQLCTIPITCACSPQARCLGRLLNTDRSICLCPPGQFGPRCYLSNSYICHDDKSQPKCLNSGRCIPTDEYLQENQQPFRCICPRGFTGDRCELQQTQLTISFGPHLIDHLSQSMLVHFIQAFSDRRHENITTFKNIPFNFSSVSIFWSHPFHIVFVEFHRHQYYLAFVRSVFNQSEVKMRTTIRSSDRCPHIRELASSKLVNSHLLYRIKFYHTLCQSNNTMQHISCFYDDVHFCLCQSSPRNGDRREANCLEYDHNRKFDCLGQNACENDGQCFQDNPTCPQTSVCRCVECSYGRRCQFKMDGFRLSLDAILGYHIQPGLLLRQQPFIVHLALSLIIVLTVIGFINGLFSLVTFKNRKLCEVGCGLYLLGSSVTTLLTMFLLLWKIVTLLTSQMGLLTNSLFLSVNCRLVDYLLRVCLNLDQWLSACVSLERAISTWQGVTFNKSKSRAMGKRIIIFLVVLMVSITIYDPMYRSLIDDKMNSHDEDDRIWCVAAYPYVLQTVDSTIQMIQFCVPFVINVISAVIIIWQSARLRRKSHLMISFRKILGQQFRHHKHILIGPIVIVVLSVPRLVLAITSGCMKSNNQSRIYLAGYLISFAPALLSFVIFVLPSKLYKKEFQYTVQQYRKILLLSLSLAPRRIKARY